FILFGLFEQTKFFLQNWLKFVFSKCLELVGFFMAFYFCTSIIDNFIKKLLNFKVCFKSFGDWLFKDIDLNHDFSCTGFDCMAEPFVEAYKWVLELIKNLFNLIVYPDVTGLGGHGQFFVFYCVNVAITAILVFMFDMMTKEMMGIIGNILTIDGASATMGGGKSAMQESTSGKFGLSQQLKDFAGTTGLGELQKSADGLSWTRGIYDLNKGLGENIANGALKGARVGKHLASAAGRAALAGIRGLRGNRVGAKNDIKKAGANLLEAFGELTGDAFDKNSMFDIDPKDTAAKLREDSVLSKVIAENDRSTSFKNLGRDEAETDSEKSVESLLMAKNSAALREKLKKLSSEELREIFDEETAERFSELQEDGFIEDEDEIDDLHIERIREYLKTYAKHGKDAKNKLAVSGISYNVFSDNFGKAAQPRPPVPDAIRNLSKSDRLGKMLARPIGGEEDQKYLIKRMTKFNNRTVEKLLGRKGGLTNISIAIARARYKEYGKHGIDVKLFTVQEYENMRKILGKIRYDGIAKKTEKLLRDGLGEKDLKKGLLKLDETTVRAVLDPARADRIMNAKAQLAAGEIKSKEVALGDLNDYRDDIQHFVDSKDYDNPVTGLPPPAPDPAPDGGGQAFQAGRGSDTEDEKQIDDSVLFGEDGNNKKVDSSAIIDTGNSDVIVSAGDVSVICNTGDVSSIIKAGDVGTVVSTAKESGDGDSSKKAATKEEQFKQQQEAREKMEKKLNKLKKQREELDREDQERKERENEKKKK
ncbi:MAG: type IV secretion system protein, partial [Rickettsiales bacterium]|nr:type IV secretion system protein [Rickettsiales bacterium]